jgi:hypothetical protein
MARPIPPPLARIIGEITAAVRRGTAVGPELLVQFVATRDEAAFRDLVPPAYKHLDWSSLRFTVAPGENHFDLPLTRDQR